MGSRGSDKGVEATPLPPSAGGDRKRGQSAEFKDAARKILAGMQDHEAGRADWKTATWGLQ